MRFDRRKIYPDPNRRSVFSGVRAIIPKRIGGTIKQLGNPKFLLSLNRAVGKIEDHTQWIIPAGRMNRGGVSDFFGSRRGSFGGDPYPPEWEELIQQTIDSFPEEPTSSEVDAISNFMLSQLEVGNWDLMYAFHSQKLTAPANCNHDWISLTADWLSNSPTGPITNVGLQLGFYDPGYTSLLNTKPMNTIATEVDNLGYYVFVEDDQTGGTGSPSNQNALISVAGTNPETLYTNPANDTLFYQGPVGGALSSFVTDSLADQSLYGIFREDAANNSYYKNGALADTQASTSSGVISDQTLRIGGGTPTISYLGIVSSVLITKAIGFDHAAYNTALLELNAALSA